MLSLGFYLIRIYESSRGIVYSQDELSRDCLGALKIEKKVYIVMVVLKAV